MYVLVTISKLDPSTTNFQGYLCQVRQVGQEIPVGTFQPVDATKSKPIDCTSESVSCCQAYSVTPINISILEDVQ